MIVDLADLERSLPLAWAEVGERHEQRRHDRERPLLPPDAAFVPVESTLAAIRIWPRAIVTPVKVEPFGAALPLVNFGTGPPPDLRADARAPRPLAQLESWLDGFDGRVLLAADSAGRREVMLEMLRRQDLAPAIVSDWIAFAAGHFRLALAVAPDVRGLVLPAAGSRSSPRTSCSASGRGQERRRRRGERDPEAISARARFDLSPGARSCTRNMASAATADCASCRSAAFPAEFLVIEYAGGDLLYVPVHALDRITRYTGGAPESAPWHRLGTDQWAKARRRAADRVRDVAAELLDSIAPRGAAGRTRCNSTSSRLPRFRSGFPFEETIDQHDAIEAVLADLRSGRPMDRLVCGDVGFGKTEVRSARCFAAVSRRPAGRGAGADDAARAATLRRLSPTASPTGPSGSRTFRGSAVASEQQAVDRRASRPARSTS